MTPFEIGILSLVFFFSLEHKFLRVIHINFKKQFFDFLLKEVSKVLLEGKLPKPGDPQS